MKTPHSSAPRGKRIYVKLKTGEVFIDKFIKNENHWVYFENRKVHVKEMKSFSIYRNPCST